MNGRGLWLLVDDTFALKCSWLGGGSIYVERQIDSFPHVIPRVTRKQGEKALLTFYYNQFGVPSFYHVHTRPQDTMLLEVSTVVVKSGIKVSFRRRSFTIHFASFFTLTAGRTNYF